jgi:hypothetical protein
MTFQITRAKGFLGIPLESCPPYFSAVDEQMRLYRGIARWCAEIGVKSIGGPVATGALLAQGVFVASEGNIRAFFIPKEKAHYCRLGHGPGVQGKRRGPFLLIDDCVDTGNQMNHCLKYIKAAPRAILILQYNFEMLKVLPDKVSDVVYVIDER